MKKPKATPPLLLRLGPPTGVRPAGPHRNAKRDLPRQERDRRALKDAE